MCAHTCVGIYTHRKLAYARSPHYALIGVCVCRCCGRRRRAIFVDAVALVAVSAVAARAVFRLVVAMVAEIVVTSAFANVAVCTLPLP